MRVSYASNLSDPADMRRTLPRLQQRVRHPVRPGGGDAAQAAGGRDTASRAQNVVRARSFADMLDQALRRYQSRRRSRTDHRGVDRARQSDARSAGARRSAASAKTSSPSTTGSVLTTALSRSWATRYCVLSLKNSSRPFAPMSPSTGPRARTSAPNCACSSSASSPARLPARQAGESHADGP